MIASLDCGDRTARLVEPVAAELRDPGAVPLTMLDVLAAGVVEPCAPACGPPRGRFSR